MGESKEHGALYTAMMHFIGGTLGGMTGVAASYPLDTIKVTKLTLLCTPNFRSRCIKK
jgi:hypothetical protein